MDIAQFFFGERSLTKVAAVFDTRGSAQAAAASAATEGDLDVAQVRIVEPFDRDVGEKLEPESKGIWRTLVRAHLTCGALGLLAGAVLFAVLWASGSVAVQTTPGLSLVAMSGFGGLLGLIAGGALTIRPDHELVIAPVRDAARTGRWAVVVHPLSHLQRDRVLHALQGHATQVVSTL